MLFTDLLEVKTLLGIDPANNNENAKLLFFIEYASDLIELIINNPGLSYKERTEIYKGTGKPKLLLKSRPVTTNPLPRVWVDKGATFGTAPGAFPQPELTYGTDFCLDLDSEDLTKSRSGILIKIGDAWPKQYYRERGYLATFVGPDTGSVKVIYTGGYTVDNLPSPFRLACNLIIARLRYIFPLGVELTSESYEDRHIAVSTSQREGLLALAKPLLLQYRNWKF